MIDFGLLMFATDYAIAPDLLAKEAEAHGFESLFLPEHTHIPASRKSPWPGGAELPQEYWHTYDPFVALSMAAAVTETLKLGTGISLITERDPILMAKQVASLDFLSKGRVVLGIGAGWNAEEMENHGTPWNRRWKIVRERIEAMKAIWTQDEACYDGEFVQFDPIWSWPKPVQTPHPPILVGGDAPGTFKRVLRYGDAWFPSLNGNEAPSELKQERMAELAALAKDAGREPFPITTNATPRNPAAIEKLAKAGVTRCLFGLKAAPADDVLPRLDKLATFLKL